MENGPSLVPDLTPHSASDARPVVAVAAMVGLLVLTIVARGAALLLVPAALTGDPDGYAQLADNLWEHRTLGSGQTPTAYRPPLYPLMLAPCMALGEWSRWAVALLHLALVAMTVWLVVRLGVRWGLGRLALLAGVLVACDPILSAQSAQIMTETPATLLAVALLGAMTSVSRRPSKRGAALAGVLTGLAALCRPTFLVFGAMAAVVLPWFADSRRSRLAVLAVYAGSVAAVLTPWVVRNQRQLARPIVATTHGGFTLLLGNNPQFYQYLREAPQGSVWDNESFQRQWNRSAAEHAPEGEWERDRLAYRQARRNIAAEPPMFAWSCAVRVARFWSPFPHQVDPDEPPLRRWARYLTAAWYVGMLALAIVGLIAGLWKSLRQGRRPPDWLLWGGLLAATFTAVHAIYWSNLRMRAPLMPVVVLALCYGVAWFRDGISGRKSLS